MANTKSAAKRTRQSEKREARNTATKTGLKGRQKKLRASLAAGDKEAAIAGFKETASLLDRAAKRGVIHPNAAARRKSRLNKALASLS